MQASLGIWISWICSRSPWHLPGLVLLHIISHLIRILLHRRSFALLPSAGDDHLIVLAQLESAGVGKSLLKNECSNKTAGFWWMFNDVHPACVPHIDVDPPLRHLEIPTFTAWPPVFNSRVIAAFT